MIQVSKDPSRQAGGAAIASVVTLAVWRLRSTWHLLLVSGMGVLAAVVVICTVPLFTQVSMTAGLRSLLTATPQDAELDLHTTAVTLETTSVAEETQKFTSLMQQYLGSYLTSASQFVIQVPPLATDVLGASQIELTGVSIAQASPHLTLVQGQLPQPDNADLELAVTPQTATSVGLTVGSTLTIPLRVSGKGGQFTETIRCQVVGLFIPRQGDPFWHGNTFGPESLGDFTNYRALMSSDAFVLALDRLAARDDNGAGFILQDQPSVSWYYHLNVSQIGITQLDDLRSRLATAQSQLADNTTEASYLNQLQLLGPAGEVFGEPSTLDRFRDRAAVVQIPVTILALQIVALVLFFISLMTDLLVGRQAEAIALLRSRGASRRQILGSFVVQSLGLGAIALALGPWLAIEAARLLAQGILSPAEQGALNVLAGNPLPLAQGVGWYALAATACASFTLIVAARGATSRTVLNVRREVAREARRPLWQRWYLDVVATLLAMAGYGVSLYVTHAGVTDAQVNLLISTPLALAAPLFLVLAGLLFLLRFFPSLVRQLARVASRRPEAAPMLALAQMARAPRQALRLILLLGLTTSFAIFSLVFTATQPQQLANVAAHLAGADFSGSFVPTETAPPTLAQRTAAYRALPGVTSATLGYAADITIQGTTVAVRAMDSRTFAQTAIWTDQDSSQSLASLLAQLTSDQALRSGKIPVIVDALVWERLRLAIGAQVLLPLQTGVTLPLIVVAEVQHLPTVNDSLSGGASDYTPPGGLLLDFQTLAGRVESLGATLSVNAVWLRTSDDPTLLAGIRAALRSGPLQLEDVQDRRLILADFQGDPLYLTMLGVLSVGVIATLLLAVAGSLLVSWLNAHQRLTNFAVLRALGTEPHQVAGVLLWEQGIVYAAALALGAVFGALLALTVVPALVFTGAPNYGNALSSGEFYTLQHALPVQIVLPLSLLVVFAALVALCVGALWLMARIVSQPTLSQTLRLNED